MEKWMLALVALAAPPQSALAHHLDDYDARIRSEAHLPADWFSCRKETDCTLASVPCQSGLAVNSKHGEEAQEILNNTFYFCLGSRLNDSVAACEARECVTRPKKTNPESR